MNSGNRHRQIDTLRQPIAVLQERAMQDPEARLEVQAEALEELQVMLEELQLADEELTTTHQLVVDERQRYRELFDFAPDGYLVTDATGIIQEANHAAAAMLGMSSGRLVGKPLVVFVVEADRQAFRTRLNHLAQVVRVQDWEVHLQPRQGAVFPVALTVAAVHDHQDRLSSLRWWLSDVTARKQAEEALRHARDTLEQRVAERTAALQQANTRLQTEIEARQQIEEELLKVRNIESIGVLAGGLAHDFNNLLTAILGNISLARMVSHPHASLATLLTKAENACQQATALTRQLLTFAKGGAPIRQTAAIADLVEESAGFALRGSNVRCTFSFPPELWSVDVDPGQMHQVFHNIVLNADQAMPDGGHISIQAENLVLEANDTLPLQPGEYVKIAIRDQGCGIPAGHLPKIFDPYFTTKNHGSGLGLTTAYTIITKHDGYIAVESQEGVETTFAIYLPASHDTPSPSEDAAAPSDLAGTGRFLVMDDDPMVRELVSDILTSLGYEVETAGDGAEAIALYQSARAAGRPFTAVILDLTVAGGMGGKEAITRLQALDPQVKAIVSSGYSDDPVLANFRHYGFCGMVAKPYTVKGLSDVLQRVLTVAPS